jgi:hypothetical protein
MVKLVVVDDPEAETSPVPTQPVQTHCVPEGPANGEVTEAVIEAPESSHPLVGVGES